MSTASLSLVEKAVEQIKEDIANNDTTAIEEMLLNLPEEVVKNFLPKD